MIVLLIMKSLGKLVLHIIYDTDMLKHFVHVKKNNVIANCVVNYEIIREIGPTYHL